MTVESSLGLLFAEAQLLETAALQRLQRTVLQQQQPQLQGNFPETCVQCSRRPVLASGQSGWHPKGAAWLQCSEQGGKATGESMPLPQLLILFKGKSHN